MEFTLGSASYKTGTLNAFTQLHISRRLAPCLASLATLFDSKLVLKEGADGPDLDGDLEAALMPLAQTLASLKDEDVEYIINACVAVAAKKNEGGSTGWQPLAKDAVPMFTLSLPTMLAITYHTIKENMTDFFTELPLAGALGEMMQKMSRT